jgi:hypothetical protein
MNTNMPNWITVKHTTAAILILFIYSAIKRYICMCQC